MDWGIDDSIENEPASEAKAMVPEGDHTFVIRKATEGAHKFKDGEFLMLQLADEAKEFGLLFCDIEKGKRGAALASSLATATGAAAFGGKVSLDAAELVGQRVVAEIYHYASPKTGKVYANVRRFKAAEPVVENAEATSRSPAKRTAAQRIAGDTDDIPF